MVHSCTCVSSSTVTNRNTFLFMCKIQRVQVKMLHDRIKQSAQAIHRGWRSKHSSALPLPHTTLFLIHCSPVLHRKWLTVLRSMLFLCGGPQIIHQHRLNVMKLQFFLWLFMTSPHMPSRWTTSTCHRQWQKQQKKKRDAPALFASSLFLSNREETESSQRCRKKEEIPVSMCLCETMHEMNRLWGKLVK